MAASMKTRILEAKLTARNLIPSQNPFHLAMKKAHWRLLNSDNSDSIGFLALSSSADDFSVKNVIATAVIVDSTLDSQSCRVDFDGPVLINCSSEFLQHYGFQNNEIIYIKPIDLLPLDKVVIACKSDQSFEWAKSRSFSVGLLCNVCQEKTLFRKNDSLLTSIPPSFQDGPSKYYDLCRDLEVIECTPVIQGFVTVKTEIIVSKAQLPGIRLNLSPDVTQQAVLVSDFLTGGLFDSLTSDGPLLDLHQTSADNHISLSFNVQYTPLVTNCDPLTEQNCIYLSESIASQHGLFRDALVDVVLSSSSEPGFSRQGSFQAPEEGKSNIALANWKKHGRNGSIIEGKPKKSKWQDCQISRIHIINNGTTGSKIIKDPAQEDGDTAQITPWVFFHIAKQQRYNPNQRLLLRKHQGMYEEYISASSSWSHELPYASEVHVSVVHGPNYSAGHSYSQAIQKFFQMPRIVKKGDVLSISTKPDLEYHQDLIDGANTRNPVIYLKIRKILPKIKKQKVYLVDIQHTNLYQDGTDHSFVPTMMESWLNPMSAISPVGLYETINKICSIFEPHISNRSFCEDLTASVLLTGPAGCGKSVVCCNVASSLHIHLFAINCYELVGETSAATEARIKNQFQRACTYAPCLVMLKNVHIIGKDRDGNSEDSRVAEHFHRELERLTSENSEWPVVVVATSSSPKLLTADVHEGFLHHVEMKVPDEVTRREILASSLEKSNCAADVSVKYVAQRTAGMVLGDLCTLITQAKRQSYKRITKLSPTYKHGVSAVEESEIQIAGPLLQQCDFSAALDQMQAAHSDAIGAPKIPNVTWDDVGGLVKVKSEILDTIQLPLQHPELLSAGLRRSGVLLYGPPGTGKTLLAKAVATECSLNFLSVKGPELINMYVGQSEENIREVFARARSASPCVIFFDELDSLAPNRGRSGDSGGVMDRVVSQLLAELDGLNKSCDVFVIGATNRPDLLDPALLRPGRYDKLLYLGVSEDKESQFKIVKALTRKFALESGCCLQNVVEKCPYNMTGADFYALCSDAMLNAMKRRIALLDAGKAVDDGGVEVSEEDFFEALVNLVPSVSEAELRHYNSLQSQFTQRT